MKNLIFRVLLIFILAFSFYAKPTYLSAELRTLQQAANKDGWVRITEAWTYSDSSTITVPSDATLKYGKGYSIKCTNSTVKYWSVYAVTSTTLKVTGGTGYPLTNTTISDCYYSIGKPYDFPQRFSFSPTVTKGGGSGTLASYTVTEFSFYLDNSRVHLQMYIRYDIDTNSITHLNVTLPVPGKAPGFEQYLNHFTIQDGSSTEAYGYGALWSNSSTLSIFKAQQAAMPINGNNAYLLGNPSYSY